MSALTSVAFVGVDFPPPFGDVPLLGFEINAPKSPFDYLFTPLGTTAGTSPGSYAFALMMENGTFVINSTSSPTFTAQVTPEPSALAALGLSAVVVLRRRNRA